MKEIKVLRKADDSFTLFVNLDSSDYKYQTAGDVGVYPENIDYEEFA